MATTYYWGIWESLTVNLGEKKEMDLLNNQSYPATLLPLDFSLSSFIFHFSPFLAVIQQNLLFEHILIY